MGYSMKTKFSVIVLLASLVATNSFASITDDCDRSDESTIGMKMCASVDFTNADAQLNLEYKKIVSKLKQDASDEYNKETLKRLVKAQKAWISFRDAECDLQATEMLGGTGEGLVALGCLRDLTEKRTSELKSFFGEK